MNKSENKSPRPLYEIAEDIRRDWKDMSLHASPYWYVDNVKYYDGIVLSL